MQRYLLDLLECPICHGMLTWEVQEEAKDQIEAGQATCRACRVAYPIREGIGLFLTPDLPREDLWQAMESQLARQLREHPQVRAALMERPLEELGPADRFYRALVLEEEGRFGEAADILSQVLPEIYTADSLACHERQLRWVTTHLVDGDGPIVDLASGRGQLVERLARSTGRPLVATDFSLRVLRRNCRWLRAMGLDNRVSLLAFDARRTPFCSRGLQSLTTNLGLPNIREPGQLLLELRRIVRGEFLAVSVFYPDADPVHREPIRHAGLEALLYRDSALEQFRAAGWQVRLVEECQGTARPTPTSSLLDGAGIDGLPIAETALTWCTLVAC